MNTITGTLTIRKRGEFIPGASQITFCIVEKTRGREAKVYEHESFWKVFDYALDLLVMKDKVGKKFDLLISQWIVHNITDGEDLP